MKPFFQGKIDVFCAIYAVLNALKVTHHIRTLHGRDIFHEALMGLAQNPKVFRAVLEQQTDYIALVDAMLSIQSKKMPLIVEKPFENIPNPSEEEVWERISQWLAPNVLKGEPSLLNGVTKINQNNLMGHCVIFRFLRYLMPQGEPVNKHWTTAYYINDKGLQFFDCSLEESAIYSITLGSFATNTKDVCAEKLCCIDTSSIRFLAPRIPHAKRWQ